MSKYEDIIPVEDREEASGLYWEEVGKIVDCIQLEVMNARFVDQDTIEEYERILNWLVDHRM